MESKNARRKARRYKSDDTKPGLYTTAWPVELLAMSGKVKNRERMFREARHRHGVT